MKLSEFKIGDIVVIIKNKDNRNSKYFPEGLVTKVIKGFYPVDEKKFTVKALKSKLTWTYLTNKRLECRPANKREQFLYHILGSPFILEKE